MYGIYYAVTLVHWMWVFGLWKKRFIFFNDSIGGCMLLNAKKFKVILFGLGFVLLFCLTNSFANLGKDECDSVVEELVFEKEQLLLEIDGLKKRMESMEHKAMKHEAMKHKAMNIEFMEEARQEAAKEARKEVVTEEKMDMEFMKHKAMKEAMKEAMDMEFMEEAMDVEFMEREYMREAMRKAAKEAMYPIF
jgi:hypothetical protein